MRSRHSTHAVTSQRPAVTSHHVRSLHNDRRSLARHTAWAGNGGESWALADRERGTGRSGARYRQIGSSDGQVGSEEQVGKGLGTGRYGGGYLEVEDALEFLLLGGELGHETLHEVMLRGLWNTPSVSFKHACLTWMSDCDSDVDV
eukprot:1768168-Rhodomonas_salina.1